MAVHHTVAVGTVRNGVTEMVLQQGYDDRVVVIIDNDRTGCVKLQHRIGHNHRWYSTKTWPKNQEEMQHLFIHEGINFCLECENFFIGTVCKCGKLL